MESKKELNVDSPELQNQASKKVTEEINLDKINNSEKSISIGSVTNVTNVIDVTDVTNVTYPFVTRVTSNKGVWDAIFGDSTFEQILKILATENRAFTYEELSERLDKSLTTIKMAMGRKKEYFGQKHPDGKICYSYLLLIAVDEINRRIKDYTHILEQKEEMRIAQENEKNSETEIIIEVKNLICLDKDSECLKINGNVVYINFTKLLEFNLYLSKEIESYPEKAIKLFEQALEESGLVKNPRIRIFNLPKSFNISIEGIRKVNLNSIVSIFGRSIRLSDVRPQVVNAKFECPSCGTVISVLQIEKKFREPRACSCGRRGGFSLIEKEMVDTARLVLEDLQEKTDNPHAKRINCFVKEDLVSDGNINILYPGNEIEIVGILKEVSVPLNTGGLSTRFEIAIEVISIRKLEEEVELNKLTKDEIEEIIKVSQKVDENGLIELTPSFAPDIFGNDKIKEGLMLQLCSKKNIPKSGKTIKKQKNKPNILLIGDPGISKTVLGDFSIDITPGSRKAVGGSSSAVGLTASVVKDDFDGGWTVEGGTLALAKDLALIDELNNSSEEDKPKLQEQMSEHTITVSKATINRTLKAPAGLLGIANPIHGYFNEGEDLVKQFNLPSPIINRFDLIFVIKDVVNEENDKKIAEKIIDRERGKIIPKYSEDFLRKFFVYIKEQPNPEINDTVAEKLKNVYIKLREYKTDSLNINPRVQVALLQLCKASAKIRLSNFVEEKDIERALDLLHHSYFKTPDHKHFKINGEK
jgi:replicative DNA helicase Mcm